MAHRSSTSKLLERTSQQLRGSYRRQSGETEETQLNDFLQEVRQQTALSSTGASAPAGLLASQPVERKKRRKKVHLGSDVSDISMTSSSSGGARAAAANRFLKSTRTAAQPQPQPSSEAPKRTQSRPPAPAPAPGRHSAALQKASRLTSQQAARQSQPIASAATSTSLSTTSGSDRPKSRKARLLPTAAEAHEAEAETRHQLYRHSGGSLDFLSESESHSFGRDGARFLRKTTDGAPQPMEPPPAAAKTAQPPMTPKSPKQLRFSTENDIRSYPVESEDYGDDEETHSGTADRLVIHHRPPLVPPIDTGLESSGSLPPSSARKPALKKSSSFSDIEAGSDAAALLETTRQFESIDTDEPSEAVVARQSVDAASDSDSGGGSGVHQNIIFDFDQLAESGADEASKAEEAAATVVSDDEDLSVAEEISTAEASDHYDSDFEAEAAPTYTQDFDEGDRYNESQRPSSWDSSSHEAGSSASEPTVREEIYTGRDDSSRSRSSSHSSSPSRSRSRTPTATSSSISPRRPSRRPATRDAEAQTPLHQPGRDPAGGGLRYQWDPVGLGEATVSRGLGLGSVDPTPIASVTVPADALEAVTAYSPASLALNSLVRDQLALTAAFLAAQRRIYQSAVESVDHSRRGYTTLEETREITSPDNIAQLLRFLRCTRRAQFFPTEEEEDQPPAEGEHGTP